MANRRTLPELADLIQSSTNSIYRHLEDSNLPQPSLSADAPRVSVSYPSEIQDQRIELLGALDELRALILGPTSYIYYASILNPAWTATFDVLYRHKIAIRVPKEGAIAVAELAKQCDLDESDLSRIIRAAISLRIFEEEPVGFVRHNAISSVLANERAHDAMGFFTEEFTPAALALSASLSRFPGSDKAGEASIAIANNNDKDKDIFSVVHTDLERMRRFANAMSFNATVPETALYHVVENVPWSAKIGAQQRIPCPKVIVDIGGSQGDLCEALLRAYADVEKAVVEDLPGVIKKNKESPSPEDLQGRIEHQPYDFFTPQVVKDADVYLFRTVLHDWPDSYAVKILQNQVPAMKHGASLLINDICIDPANVGSSIISQAQCAHDLFVKMGVNARERTRQDWEALLMEADQRFQLESIITPSQSVHSLIHVVWQGE